ncbi:hypothetical protein GCM10023078_38950 [Gibbsiella greigii]
MMNQVTAIPFMFQLQSIACVQSSPPWAFHSRRALTCCVVCSAATFLQLDTDGELGTAAQAGRRWPYAYS